MRVARRVTRREVQLKAPFFLVCLVWGLVSFHGSIPIDGRGHGIPGGMGMMVAASSTGEASIDEYGNVITDDGEDKGPPLKPNESFGIIFNNQSPYRVDVHYDDGEYGTLYATMEKGESWGTNAVLDQSFFVTRHGVKEGLFIPTDDGSEERLIFTANRRGQKFVIPSNAAPSDNPCQDRFSICSSLARDGACEQAPGWMIVHCCQACDAFINSSKLIDPKIRCSKEQLNTPEPVWKKGDLNKLFESWATNDDYKKRFGFEVVSAPDPKKYNATWGGAKVGSPWVVLFNDFLTEMEIDHLIRGGEIQGYERSTDQGEANALGEQAKVVSQTRTSSNAWCMDECERMPGVKTATDKIEEFTGIPRVNYESFQLLHYEKNQFYRSHHDSSEYDDSPAGQRILTFFLYLTDVEEGGETYFNRLGLSIKPKKGRALVWPSVLDEDPNRWDARMYHEAKDVIKGKKLAANHWIHLNDYHTPNDWGCTGSFT